MTTERFFAATAMPDRRWWAALWPHPERVLTAMGIKSSMTVVDLCCGDGYFTAPLAKLVHGKVIALDIDCTMLEQAKAEVTAANATVQQWVCDDAMSLGAHVTTPVDFVLMANTFHGVFDKGGLARSIRAVLGPDGLLGIINWHPSQREDTSVLGEPRGPSAALRMSPQAVSAVVEPAGFQSLRVVAFPPYHYGALFGPSPFSFRRCGK